MKYDGLNNPIKIGDKVVRVGGKGRIKNKN